MKRRHGINTSRQARSQTTDSTQVQPTPLTVSNALPQQSGLPCDTLQLEAHQSNHQQSQVAQVTLGATAAPITVCDSQIQQQPAALVHKTDMETHQSHHLYHHENTLSQHSLHSQEDDSMSSHHEVKSSACMVESCYTVLQHPLNGLSIYCRFTQLILYTHLCQPIILSLTLLI